MAHQLLTTYLMLKFDTNNLHSVIWSFFSNTNNFQSYLISKLDPNMYYQSESELQNWSLTIRCCLVSYQGHFLFGGVVVVVLPVRVRVVLGVMGIMGYSTFPRAPELESHNQMLFSVIPRTLFNWWCGGGGGGVLPPLKRGTVSIF